MMKIILIMLLSLFFLATLGTKKYDFEVCDDTGICKRIPIINIVQPSLETTEICYQGRCENVPINRLLFKGGVNKTICNFYSAGGITFVDNYWNSEGLIDGCEMPVNSNMQFIFKQHDQSIRSHTGMIQVKIDVINYEAEYKALQVFVGEDDKDVNVLGYQVGDNLPNSWIYCGNVDKIKGRSTKLIQCNGTNLKFIKLVNAPWNKGSLFIDNVEILKAGDFK